MNPVLLIAALVVSAALPIPAAGQPPQAHSADDAGKFHMPEKRVFSTATPPVRRSSQGDGRVAWDHFDHRGNFMWGCRETGSGEFVVNRLCRDKPRNDDQWPGMEVPSNYRGILVD